MTHQKGASVMEVFGVIAAIVVIIGLCYGAYLYMSAAPIPDPIVVPTDLPDESGFDSTEGATSTKDATSTDKASTTTTKGMVEPPEVAAPLIDPKKAPSGGTPKAQSSQSNGIPAGNW